MTLGSDTKAEDAIKAIRKFPRLTRLNVSRIRFQKDGWEAIASLSDLQDLNLSNCEGNGDNELEVVLPKLKWLTRLDLGGTQVTIASLLHLPPRLNWLSLNYCPHVNDASLAGLAHLRDLATLNLSNCPITGEGLHELSALPNLKKLLLNYCRNLTDAGLSRMLKSSMVKTVRVGGCPLISKKMRRDLLGPIVLKDMS